MTGARPVPKRHWRSYEDNAPLPTGAEALDEPFNAFPSWFLRIECDRCDKVRWVNQVHLPQASLPLRQILDRTRHVGCGGRAGKAELLDGAEAPIEFEAGASDRAAGLANKRTPSHAPAMFVISDADAAAIRTALQESGEFAAAIELRRRLPGITDIAQAREFVRTVAGWKPRPPRPVKRMPKGPR